MIVFTHIYIDLTLDAANDPHFDPPTPPQTPQGGKSCIHLATCSNPYCFKHGCLNVLLGNAKEVRS